MKNLLLITMALCSIVAMQAQTPGQPDINFDGDGYVRVDFENAADFGYTIARYGNDIVTGGIADSAGFRKPAFTRLRSDGSFNNLLGGDGAVRVSPQGLESSIYDMAVQADNKIVAVGDLDATEKGMVYRINGSGSIDQAFGVNGYFTHLKSGKDREFYYDALMQDDGKILVTGYTCLINDCNMILARLKANGTPDSTFGTNGFVYSTTSGTFEGGENIAVDANGKILVAGGNGSDIVLFRYNANGTPDNSFSLDGRVTYNAGFSENASGIAIQPDGKIVVSGDSYNRPQPSAIVLRFNTDGTFDNTFGNNGVIDTSFTGDCVPSAMLLQPDGKILLAGRDDASANTRVFLARLNSNGTPDNSFGTGGYYTGNFNSDGEALYDICLLSDGRLAGAGFMKTGVSYDMLTAIFATGISVGILDFNTTQNTLLVFPNPVQSEINIAYELLQEETLTVSLFDLAGKQVHQFTTHELNTAGKHTRAFQLPINVTAGQYILNMQSAQGSQSIYLTIQ